MDDINGNKADEQLDEMEMSFDGSPNRIPQTVPPKIKKFKQSNKYSKLVQSYLGASQAKKIWKKISCWLLLVLVIALTIAIYVAIFELIASLLTGVGSVFIMAIAHFFIFRIFCKFWTYPGSYKLWLRELEYKFCQQTSRNVKLRVNQIASSVEQLSAEELNKWYEVLSKLLVKLNTRKFIPWDSDIESLFELSIRYSSDVYSDTEIDGPNDVQEVLKLLELWKELK